MWVPGHNEHLFYTVDNSQKFEKKIQKTLFEKIPIRNFHEMVYSIKMATGWKL